MDQAPQHRRGAARAAHRWDGSRAELAQRTGLAKATVGTIVAALEADGALAEEPEPVPAPGAPGGPVALAA